MKKGPCDSTHSGGRVEVAMNWKKKKRGMLKQCVMSPVVGHGMDVEKLSHTSSSQTSLKLPLTVGACHLAHRLAGTPKALHAGVLDFM